MWGTFPPWLSAFLVPYLDSVEYVHYWNGFREDLLGVYCIFFPWAALTLSFIIYSIKKQWGKRVGLKVGCVVIAHQTEASGWTADIRSAVWPAWLRRKRMKAAAAAAACFPCLTFLVRSLPASPGTHLSHPQVFGLKRAIVGHCCHCTTYNDGPREWIINSNTSVVRKL